MTFKVAVVVVDRGWMRMGVAQGVRSQPTYFEFIFDGSCWYEALDMVVTKYAQHIGASYIDADDLELRSCSIINLDA